MNKFINALLLFTLFPTMLFTIAVGFDMPIEFLRTSGQQLPYRFEIFLALGLFIFIILLRRTVRRWMGMRLVNQLQKFKWNQRMSQERIKRVIVYTIMEAVVLFFVGSTLYNITDEAIFPALAFCFATLDNFIFLFYGTRFQKFRIGVTSKAIISADREVSLIYFYGLRKISIHQQSIFFDYIKGLQLSFPLDCVPASEKETFFNTVEAQLDTDKVFITSVRD
jgi:predicted membrane protein